MKLKNLFLGSLACLAFAACSNDDDAVVNPGAENGHFVTINIAVPNETRAATEDFETGSDVENAVSGSALFVFFKSDGSFHSAADVTLAWNDGTQDLNPALSRLGKAYVMFDEPTNLPASVIAVLNTDLTSTSSEIANKSLSEIKALVGEYSSTSKFVMTNSVWANSSEVAITNAHLTEKAEKGTAPTETEVNGATPVNIYVERVLAKVKVLKPTSLTVNSTTIEVSETTDGKVYTYKDLELIPAIKGYHLSYTAPESYLIKNITDCAATWDNGTIYNSTTVGYENWSDDSNKRSYWAYSAPTSVWSSSADPAWGHDKYSESVDHTSDAALEFYCLENTLGSNGDNTTATKLVVTAQLTTDGSTSVGNLIKYMGMYYLESDFLKLAAQKLIDAGFDYETSTPGTYSSDWAAYLKTTRTVNEKAWEVIVTTKNDMPAVIRQNKSTSDVAAIQTLLGGMDKAWEWQDGRCYYFIDVNHINSKPAIIRNHIYSLNITAISGLGTPVYNPDTDEDGTPDEDEEEEIIPEKPTPDAFFVAAKLDILKWRIVGQQNVTLE